MEDTNHNVLCVDPRQALNYGGDIYEIEKSSQTVSYYKQTANTINNSQLSWNIQVPSKSVLTDRKIFLECKARVTLTGTRANGTTFFPIGIDSFRGDGSAYLGDSLLNSCFCMRGNPVSKACDSLTVYVNGMSITTRISDYSSIFDNVNLWEPDAYRFIHSGAWGRGDSCQRLKECGTNVDLAGPFGGFTQTSNTVTKRNDQTRYRIISNPTAVGEQELEGVVEVSWFEQVMVGPFMQALSKSDSKAIGGVNQLQFVYSLSNLERMVLIPNPSDSAAANSVNSVSVNITDAVLHMCYLTPTSVMGSLPPVLRYNSKLLINYPTPVINDMTRTQSASPSQGEYRPKQEALKGCNLLVY